jgi:hypothetical protein
MSRPTPVILSGLIVLVAGLCAAPAMANEEKFVLTGYVKSQGGIFVDPIEGQTLWYKFDPKLVAKEDKPTLPGYNEYPVEHGSKLGQLSMMRSTIMLEMDWTPWEAVNIHAIFRGVRSLQVQADDEAQPPVPTDVRNNREWVQNNFYTENDLREIYVSFDAGENLSFRVGRQQVSWGEIGQYRLLDVVNPIDSTWHFGPFESFEDQRIPLWMLNSSLNIPALEGSLDVVWIPLIDSKDRTVNTPLTFVGAWGLPAPPIQEDKGQNPKKIGRKIFQYPGGDITDSRVGARWKGSMFSGKFNYTLVYFYGHQLTPPIPDFYIMPFGGPAGREYAYDHYVNAQGDYTRNLGLMDVYLKYPRQHTFGFSTEFAIDNPVGVAIRLEAAMEPWRAFPVYSLATSHYYNNVLSVEDRDFRDPLDNRKSWPTQDGASPLIPMINVEKHVVNYAVQMMRPTMIRWLNPSSNFLFIFQMMHSVVLDFDESEHLIDVPGYDSTPTKEHDIKLVAVAMTNYLHGLLKPKIVAVYALPKDAIISASLGFVIGNHWRANLAANMFIAEDPYKGIGFFRDRDEINLSVMYQF